MNKNVVSVERIGEVLRLHLECGHSIDMNWGKDTAFICSQPMIGLLTPCPTCPECEARSFKDINTIPLRAYPNNTAARKAMTPRATCKSAR